MDWTKFLTPDALATYVVFALSILIGVVSFFIMRFINRKRPKIVRLVKIAESSLIEIDPEVREDIVVTYKLQPANSLYLATFNVSYSGEDENIEDVEIIINLQNSDIIEIIKDDPLLRRDSEVFESEENNQLVLRFPFLNRESLYQDRARIKLFALEPIKVESVTGGGRGWKVEYVDRVQLTSDIAKGISASIPASGSYIEVRLGFIRAVFDVLPMVMKLRGL